MSRRAARYTQADIARALRAFEQVNGLRGTVQIDSSGTLLIIPVDHIARSTVVDTEENSAAIDERLMRGIERVYGKKKNNRHVLPG